MDTFEGETILSVKNKQFDSKDCSISCSTGLLHICKLDDFFSNNINFELNKITILSLENCEIIQVPDIIQKLNLKQLILNRNKLKEVPSCLYSGLNTLELLDLSHNLLTNFDIEPACSCTIRILRINNNKIYNVPHWILTLRCPNLTELNYSNNHVVDLKASHSLNFKKLEMCNCDLLDVDFKFFKSIKTLEYLDLSNNTPGLGENRFKDLGKLFLNAKWEHLQIVKLNNLAISILPLEIFWISSITQLHLINCDLSWIPSDVQYLTNLTLLDVSNNSICSLPSQLSTLINLKVIKAPFNAISSVAEFTNNLEILDLYNNYLEEFPECSKNIKFIDLEKNLFDTRFYEFYDDYVIKRDKLRQRFNYDRINGSVELPNEDISGDANLSSSEEYDCLDFDRCCNNEDENWDEEENKISFPKNPEITNSDDEWEGKEEIRKIKKQKIPYFKFDINEDWIFCDVEE